MRSVLLAFLIMAVCCSAGRAEEAPAPGRVAPLATELRVLVVPASEGLLTRIAALATAFSALCTLGLFVLTLRSLRLTRASLVLTRRALVLSALVSETELVLRDSEHHPDGSLRFGGERSPARQALHGYARQVRELREQIEKLD